MEKENYSSYLPKTIQYTMSCLSYRLFLNKRLSTTKILKYLWFVILAQGPILRSNYLSKDEKEIDNFLLFKQTAKEEIMAISSQSFVHP